MKELENRPNSVLVKKALEYVLEVHDDLEAWKDLGPAWESKLEVPLTHTLDTLHALVVLYQSIRDVEDDTESPEVEEEEELGPDVYVSHISLPSLLDTTEYEN